MKNTQKKKISRSYYLLTKVESGKCCRVTAAIDVIVTWCHKSVGKRACNVLQAVSAVTRIQFFRRDRSLITFQGRGVGAVVFKKSVVSQNWTPSKNFEVKIIPPFPILVWKTYPPPPSWGGHSSLRPSLDRFFFYYLHVISCLSILLFIVCII